MDRLISQGKITYVGSSNFPGWAIARANEKASVRQQLGLISEQSLYNLIERRAELEVIPACRQYGLGLIPWSPLAGGLLAGTGGDVQGRRQSDSARAAVAERATQLEQFHTVCAELGETPSAVALAWLLHQPAVASTIIGPGSPTQLTSVLHVSDLQLSDHTLARLEEIFPPSGAAPEAYAW